MENDDGEEYEEEEEQDGSSPLIEIVRAVLFMNYAVHGIRLFYYL